MRIAHFGTFDVENYGDLLFPLVLEKRLSGLCDEVIHVSPAGGPPPWKDCVPTVGFDDFLRQTPPIDGVVIGGGQILRSSPTPLEVYDRGGVSPFTAYPGLWLGAAYIAATEGVPLCWNAPGVAGALPPVASQLARWTASVTDYPSVRDETSRDFLEKAGIEEQVHVVPDTALEVAGLWSEEEISAAYEDAFAARGREVPERSVVFHVNRRWAGEELSSVAARVERICARLDATPIVIAIGPCHGDDEIQRQVAREMETEPLLIERPRSLREVAAAIARSEAYLGSSLHGMITAVSFAKPGVLVAGDQDPKYDGLLKHLDLSSWRVDSWQAAEQRAAEIPTAAPDARERAAVAEPALEQHWNRLRAALSPARGAPGETPGAADRQAALEELPRISYDNFAGLEIFQGIIAEALEDTQAKLQDRQTKLAEQHQQRAELRQRLDQQRQQLNQQRQRLDQESQKLRDEREKSRRLQNENKQLQRLLESANGDVDKLASWLEALEEDVSAMRSSRRWRLGQSLGRIGPEGTQEVTDRLDETFEQFHTWRWGSPEARRETDDE